MALKREDIIIRFGGDASRLGKVTKSVMSTADAIRAKFARVGDAISRAFGVGGAVLGGGLITAFAKATEQLDQMGKAATGLNTTVENLAAMRHAIEQTTTIAGRDFDQTWQRLVKHIGLANSGVAESQKLFRALGLDWEYLGSLDAADAFLEVVEAIRLLPNEYQRAAMAQRLFEDRWRDLMPALVAGKDALRGLMEEQRAMGGPTTEAAQAAAELRDAINRMNEQIEALAFRYAPPAIKAINAFLAAFSYASRADTLEEIDQDLELLGKQLENLKRQESGEGGLLTRFVGWWRGAESVKDAISEVTSEIERLQKARDNLLNPPPRPKTKATGNLSGGTLSDVEKAIKKSASGGATSDDWRRKSPEEIGKALADFRAGRISAAQLGEMAGLQPPGTAAMLDALPIGAGGALSVKVDEAGLQAMGKQISDYLEKMSAQGKFRVEVVPELALGGESSIDSAATAEGYRQ